MTLQRYVPFALFCIIAAASQVSAEERGYSITGISRIRVEGPVTVIVETGRSPMAKAVGDRKAIERIKVEANGDLLMIGLDQINWHGEPDRNGDGTAVLHVGTDKLEAISILGSGDVSVDHVKGARLGLIVGGSGRATINALDVDRLTVAINGSGEAKLAGRALDGRFRLQGNGTLDAATLTTTDADILLVGGGTAKLKASRTAHHSLNGSGRIEILGDPACSGSRQGSGEVICGQGQQR